MHDERSAVSPVVWTGGLANGLRVALRLSQEGFAELLGVSVRAVAKWAGNPGMELRNGTAQLLDVVWSRADGDTRVRFERLTASPAARSDVVSATVFAEPGRRGLAPVAVHGGHQDSFCRQATPAAASVDLSVSLAFEDLVAALYLWVAGPGGCSLPDVCTGDAEVLEMITEAVVNVGLTRLGEVQVEHVSGGSPDTDLELLGDCRARVRALFPTADPAVMLARDYATSATNAEAWDDMVWTVTGPRTGPELAPVPSEHVDVFMTGIS